VTPCFQYQVELGEASTTRSGQRPSLRWYSHTGSGAHQHSYSVGIEDCFSGGKAAGLVDGATKISPVARLRLSGNMKNGVFWDVTLRRNSKCDLRRVRRLLVTASVVPSSPILVSLIKEALRSSETSFLQEPHGVTSQKSPFFIVIAVKPKILHEWKYISIPLVLISLFKFAACEYCSYLIMII
jgi:hypothetical protein